MKATICLNNDTAWRKPAERPLIQYLHLPSFMVNLLMPQSESLMNSDYFLFHSSQYLWVHNAAGAAAGERCVASNKV